MLSEISVIACESSFSKSECSDTSLSNSYDSSCSQHSERIVNNQSELLTAAVACCHSLVSGTGVTELEQHLDSDSDSDAYPDAKRSANKLEDCAQNDADSTLNNSSKRNYGKSAPRAGCSPSSSIRTQTKQAAFINNTNKSVLKAVRINLASCKYSVLRVVSKKLGWVEVDDESLWEVCWTDTSSGMDRLVRLRRPQKLNHFPGMLELARKKSMARNLANMGLVYPSHYSFFPKTFLLPEMTEALMAEFGRGKGKKTYIMKLDNGSQGRGIKLVQSAAAAQAAIPTFEHNNVVASQYIAKPFLVNGYKFDMRIYVLVRCCDPMRVFIHKEGLARFCTEKYQRPTAANIANNYTHLTNYSLNKHNPSFVFNKDAQQADDGSKWSLTALGAWMRAHGHDWEAVWASIQHVIVKSLIAIQPMLQYLYRSATRPDDDGFSCFEVLGYDVLLDEVLQPWLIEVNHSPSFTTDTPLDLAIKEGVITDAMHLVGINLERAREELAARQAARMQRLYNQGTPSATAAAKQLPVSPGAQHPVPVKPQPRSPACTALSSTTHHPSLAYPPPTSPACDAPASPLQKTMLQPPPHEPTSPGVPAQQQQGAAKLEGQAAEGAGRQGGGPLVPAEEQDAEWESVQREHEDANMGLFQRILPSDDPEQQALYEELLAGAQQVFYKQTIQGRVQHTLIQIKERRQQEEAEAAARELAHKRRVESLKAWMSIRCANDREERRRQQLQGGEVKHNERIQAVHAWQGLAANAFEQAAAEEGVSSISLRGNHTSGYSRLGSRTNEVQGAANTWGEGRVERGGNQGGPVGCDCSCHCHRHQEQSSTAGMCSMEELNVRGIKKSMQPVAGAGGGMAPGQGSPSSPAAAGTATSSHPHVHCSLVNNLRPQQEHAAVGSASHQAQAPVHHQNSAPFSPGLGSGRFIRRMASLHQGGSPAACKPGGGQRPAHLQGCGGAGCTGTGRRGARPLRGVEGGGICEGERGAGAVCACCGDGSGSGGEGQGGQHAEGSGTQGAALSASSLGPEADGGGTAPSQQDFPCEAGKARGGYSRYISPGMASVLQGGSLAAQLLQGWPSPPQFNSAHPLGPPFVTARQSGCTAPALLYPAAAAWGGYPAVGGSFSRRRSLAPVSGYGAGMRAYAQQGTGRRPLAQEQRPKVRWERCRTPGAAAVLRRRGASTGSDQGVQLAERHGSRGRVCSSLAGKTPAIQMKYIREIEQQAVKSIADMIADVLGR